MLAGIYYGVMYGGSTTSILVNVPGETASVVTCLDGYQMARQGRAGPALGMAAFGSFFAGTVGLIGLQLMANPLSRMALKFGPPEYFALILLGFSLITYLSYGSKLKACVMALLGLILSGVGLDPITSQERMTFGMINLFEGIGVAPLAMGLFGVAEVFKNLGALSSGNIVKVRISKLFPSRIGLAAGQVGHGPGNRHRVFTGNSSGRRARSCHLRCLWTGKAGGQKSGTIRERGD